MFDLENGMVAGRWETDNGAEPYRERPEKDFPSSRNDMETAAQMMERIRRARHMRGSDNA